jgi:hypothetical protein
MKPAASLTTASLLSIVGMTLHLADDIARGLERGDTANLIAVPILVTWLYGTLALAGRRSGYVIILLGSLLGLSVPFVHFTAPGGVLGSGVGDSVGTFFFIWTLIALGVTSLFALVLSIEGLWRLTSGRPRSPR